jgi:hypothetical protein
VSCFGLQPRQVEGTQWWAWRDGSVKGLIHWWRWLRRYGRPADDGIQWPPAAVAKAVLLHRTAKKMAADVEAAAEAFLPALASEPLPCTPARQASVEPTHTHVSLVPDQ